MEARLKFRNSGETNKTDDGGEDHRKFRNAGETRNPDDEPEDHRKIQISGETKKNPDDDRDFEFGSLTPSLQSRDVFSENSPADHFFNGRLLPHSFPTPRTIRTTSEDSSRSNSTDSRSRSFSPNNNMIVMRSKNKPQLESNPATSSGKPVNKANKGVNSAATKGKRRNKATEMVMAQLYGSYSQRWQYITPAPGATFKREAWSVKRCRGGGGDGGRRTAAERRRKKAEERRESRAMRWWKRILRAVTLACRECHAMEPARAVNDDVDMKGKIKFS